eukprot:m.857457 g.857457  ORF g.857457 m.857457 type:complete len:710 (-) comp23520_c0_seq12:277-2406(-)
MPHDEEETTSSAVDETSGETVHAMESSVPNLVDIDLLFDEIKDPKTGFITSFELQQLFSSHEGDNDDALSTHMLAALDTDSDGKVACDEFRTACLEQYEIYHIIMRLKHAIPSSTSAVPEDSDGTVLPSLLSEPLEQMPEIAHPESYSELVRQNAILQAKLDDITRTDHDARDRESLLKSAQASELSLKEALREREMTYDRDVMDLESQLLEREQQVKDLRIEKQRLYSQIELLQRTTVHDDDSGEHRKGSGSTSPTTTGGSSASPNSATPVQLMEHRIDGLLAERDDLAHEMQSHQFTIEELRRERDETIRQFQSKKRVSDTQLELLEQENLQLREQVGELDVLRERVAELTDLVDEQQQHLRSGAGVAPGGGATAATDGGADAAGDSVGVDTSLELAHSLLQSEVQELRKALEGKKAKEISTQKELEGNRKKIAQLASQLSVANTRIEGLTKEMNSTNTTNVALTSQVEALGMALDKMKAYLDASGNAVAKVGPRKSSVQRNGGSGIMKRLRDMRIPRSSPVKSSSGSGSVPSTPTSAALPDPIPATPVVLTALDPAHTQVTPQVLTSSTSANEEQETPGSKQDTKRKPRKGDKGSTPSKTGPSGAGERMVSDDVGVTVKPKKPHRMRSLTMPVGVSRPDAAKLKRTSPATSTTPDSAASTLNSPGTNDDAATTSTPISDIESKSSKLATTVSTTGSTAGLEQVSLD